MRSSIHPMPPNPENLPPKLPMSVDQVARNLAQLKERKKSYTDDGNGERTAPMTLAEKLQSQADQCRIAKRLGTKSEEKGDINNNTNLFDYPPKLPIAFKNTEQPFTMITPAMAAELESLFSSPPSLPTPAYLEWKDATYQAEMEKRANTTNQAEINLERLIMDRKHTQHQLESD